MSRIISQSLKAGNELPPVAFIDDKASSRVKTISWFTRRQIKWYSQIC